MSAAYEMAQKHNEDDPFFLLTHASLFVEAAKWYDEHPEIGCMPLEWAQNFHRFYSDYITDMQRNAPEPMPSALKTLILLIFMQATKWAKKNPPKTNN